MCHKCKNKIGLSTKEFHRLYYKQPKKSPPTVAASQKEIDHLLFTSMADIMPIDNVSKTIAKKHANKAFFDRPKGFDNLVKQLQFDAIEKQRTPLMNHIVRMVGNKEADQPVTFSKFIPFQQFEGSEFLTKAQKRRAEKTAATSFNTLAQFGTKSEIAAKPLKINLSALKKRARAKFFTEQYLPHLIDLNSPLKNSYINTTMCATELIQTGKKIKSSYCKNRWCTVCNRIRTAQLINEYLPDVQAMEDKHFVTLTFKNVDAYYLAPAFDVYQMFWKQYYEAYRSANKRNKDLSKRLLQGITKLECTYNADTDQYHPHLHILISGKDNAINLHNAWTNFCNDNGLIRNDLGQDIKQCDNNTTKELFKYFTKLATKTGGYETQVFYKNGKRYEKEYLIQLILLYRWIQYFRQCEGGVYNTFGLKREINEDLFAPESEEVEGIENIEAVYRWRFVGDWFNTDTSKALTGYKPSNRAIKRAKNIIV